MASPRTWPGVVEGEEKESESWKKGARAEGERWVMRISRVVSWYVTVEDEENVGIEEEGEGAGRERVQGLGSDGRIGWELGVVRYKSQWSLFIGPTVYAAPAVPIISMLVSGKSLFSFIAVRHMKEIWAFGLTKDAVQKLHFISPIPMRTLLPLWEEKTLSRIKAPPHIVESTVFTRNFNDTIKTEKVEGGAACLEDKHMRSDEE